MIEPISGTEMGDRMKLLIVSRFDRSARAINTITKYVRVGKSLGHEVALFSDPIDDMPDVPTSRDPKAFEYVMFVVYETPDFPDLPYLAHLLDGVPRERRIIVDCTGRYNETIQVEHDFNHLEKMDNHMGMGMDRRLLSRGQDDPSAHPVRRCGRMRADSFSMVLTRRLWSAAMTRRHKQLAAGRARPATTRNTA